MNSFAVPG